MKTVYVSGSMSGREWQHVLADFGSRKDRLEDLGFRVLTPLAGKVFQEREVLKHGGYTTPLANDRAIFSRDRWMVAQADIVLCDLTFADQVSIGSCFELAWAYAQPHTQVILILPEGTPEEDQERDPHDHAFIRQCADIVFHSVEDAYPYLDALLNG